MDVATLAVLIDEAGDLGPGEVRCLLEEALDHPLVSLPEAWVGHPLERPGDEGVGLDPVEVADIRQPVAFLEGPHMVDGTKLVDREIHDHTSMIAASRASGLSLVGNTAPLQAFVIGMFLIGALTRGVPKRRWAMDLGSGQGLLIGFPPPHPPPSVAV